MISSVFTMYSCMKLTQHGVSQKVPNARVVIEKTWVILVLMEIVEKKLVGNRKFSFTESNKRLKK